MAGWVGTGGGGYHAALAVGAILLVFTMARGKGRTRRRFSTHGTQQHTYSFATNIPTHNSVSSGTSAEPFGAYVWHRHLAESATMTSPTGHDNHTHKYL